MCAEFRLADRYQEYLLPPSVNDWLPADHLARFIVEVTDNLDINEIKNAYRGSGKQAYDPRMLLTLLFYGYATSVFSSRKLEQATYDSVAFRYVTANEHPDHDTISMFRKRFLPQLHALFVQILQIAHTAGLFKIGTISLDGTKIKANASKHSAYSYGHACKIEGELKKEVDELFRIAEESDNESAPEGMNVPEELARREARLEAIAEAKKEIERRAEERHSMEQAEYEKKMEKRHEKEKATGKKARGKEPQAPQPGPREKDQVNLTDEESRIMPQSGGGFEQCYNAQAAVDVDSLLITETNISQNTNDKQELEPMLDKLEELPPELGKVGEVLADAGYYSEENVDKCESHKIDPYISPCREPHYQNLRGRFEDESPVGPEVNNGSVDPVERMKSRLHSVAGRAKYAKRKSTVEPVFGIIKAVMGFRKFLLRGLKSVQGEWNLVCLAWNLKRLHSLTINKN
jgi:transposase